MAVNSTTINNGGKPAQNKNNTIIENVSNLINSKEKLDFANSEHGNRNFEKEATKENNADLESRKRPKPKKP